MAIRGADTPKSFERFVKEFRFLFHCLTSDGRADLGDWEMSGDKRYAHEVITENHE